LSSLDLDDPVQVVLNIIKDNFSEVPVTVISGFTRGGYARNGKELPRVIPVEGEVKNGRFYPRNKKTKIQLVPAKAEVYVYEVSDQGDQEETVDGQFGDIRVRVTIDIFHGESRARLQELYKEIKRCLYKSKDNPGGNYSHLIRGQKTDLTNRQAGFWRYTQDVELIKVSDYFGHD